MVKPRYIFFFVTIFLTACGTISVPPTPTATLTPTTIPLPSATPTPESTPTPEPTPTSEPVTVFDCTFEECKEKFSDWMDTRFDFVYNVRDAKVYEGRYIEIGITVYLYEIEGLLSTIMLMVVDNPLFDTKEQVMFLVKVWDYFGNQEVIDWFSENWPESQEQEFEFIEIKGRMMGLSTLLDESGAYVFMMTDTEYIP